MADDNDTSSRPAKRVRLDNDNDVNAPASAGATAAPIDEDILRETRAGITEYVCPDNLGFKGVLKQRYTDFLVNEIAQDGRVVRLRCVGVAKKENGEKADAGRAEKQERVEGGEKVEKVEGEHVKEAHEQNGRVEDVPLQASSANGEAKAEVTEELEVELSDDDRETLNSIFGENTTKQILNLVRQIRKRDHKKAKDFKAIISPPITDKETRTQAHKCLRRIFPNLLESTMEEDQSIRIKAIPPAERKGKKKGRGDRGDSDARRQKGQPQWEELGGEYLHFSLYKENKDTMEVVGFLGSKLNCGSKGFGFAGTKDRRACTVQRICVKKQTAERMQSFNKILFNSAIGDFEYRPDNLKLGDLMGNEFTITLRDCHFQNEEGLDFTQREKLANEVLEKAVKDFSEKGFINYYGLQRFGSFAASTDAIGRKMLQDDLEGAVEGLLDYSDVALAAAQGTQGDLNILVSQDDRDRAKALHIWKTEASGGKALDILSRKFTAERNIIQHLSSRNSKTGQRDRKSDWQGALMTIPRNLRLMYVHAYQSLVWNTVAGERWTKYGDTVVEGDLVLVHEHRDKEATNQPTKTATDNQDQDGEFIINPTGTENANAAASDFERARPLSASEASSGKYTIWDIVLPQPGYDVEYPKNAIGAFYEDFMGSEKGGGLDPHNMRRPWREISLSGGYRKFLSRPLEPLEFKVHSYTKEDEQFVETDLERLRREEDGRKGEGDLKGESKGEGEQKVESKEDVEMEDGEEVEEKEKKIAVVVTMQLASSQYATMALRELMKAGGVKAFKPEFMGGR